MEQKKGLEYLQITIGVLIFSLGFFFFLSPLNLVVGGMMGISVIVTQFIDIPNSVFLLILNVITLILGFIFFGKQFFIKTVYASILSPIIIFIMEISGIKDSFFTDMINESSRLLLAAILSGVIIGVGLGLVLKNNATTGGMDVIQRLVQRYAKIPYSWAVYITDGLIIIGGMIVSFEYGVFGLISLVICAFAIEKTAIAGRNTYTVLVITDYPELIKDAIFTKLDRGLTKIKAVGGYSNLDKEVIMCTMYRNEIYDLKALVKKIDPKAFTLILQTKEVVGAGFHKDSMQ